jgi:3-hydroxy-9,10-secoandrosta-1,3,5(10)-triene-9,17-dione monooxygenase reductase component
MSSPALDDRRYRDALGRFASGIVIVTGVDDGQPHGLTCQSFVSLSLNPALVMFCPARSSTTWPRLARTGQFCVNVLARGQEALSDTFARPQADRFHGVPWTPGTNGTPRLTGAIAHLECSLHTTYDGGDHHIVTGRVTELALGGPTEPLVYFRSQYRSLERNDTPCQP